MTDHASDSSDPNREHDAPTAPKPVSAKVSAYVVSWTWLLVGLAGLLLAGGAIGGLYYFRTIHLAKDVLSVGQQMIREADALKKDGKVPESIKKREDAANLLLNYNQTQATKDGKVLLELNGILESLLADQEDVPMLRRLRQNQVMENCRQLIQSLSSNRDSLRYRRRIMELEWEQGNLPNVVDRAREVLNIEREVNNRDDYPALRLLTLAMLTRLPTIGYQPIPQLNMPVSMDELLEKVHRMKPDNIEIAYRYAEFIIDVNREEFKRCASEKLLGMPTEERTKQAVAIIDNMVSLDSKNVRAYLARYDFRQRFLDEPDDPEKLDPDLQAVLDIDPDHPDGLILSGMFAYRQSVAAARADNRELADERKRTAERYLKHLVEKKPQVDIGYQFLGDFYAQEGKVDEAIRIWSAGVENNLPAANPELVGRLVVALTDRKQFEEASEKLALLTRFLQESRLLSPDVVRQIRNLISLLSARLYANEGTEAIRRADEAQATGRIDESRRLYTLSQKKTSDATQILEQLLGTFGKSPYDYQLDTTSIYSRLLGESLMLAGRLMTEQAKWSRAVFYFRAAMPFPAFHDAAAIAAANAYQQQHRSDDAIELLSRAVKQSPDNLTLRYVYAQNLFGQQMSKNIGSPGDLDAVEAQLRYLEERRDELPNPWTIDLRLIHLDMVRESISNDPDRILRAQQAAIRKLRELENREFPPPKEGEAESPDRPKIYSENLAFLAEMAGIYSYLASPSDFDRILATMLERPGGEPVYYAERISDALRRNDREGAILIVEEALESKTLTSSQKQRFVTVMQNLRDEEPETLDKIYARLKTTFEQNPDSLRPQAFFLLANMALDRNDLDYAKILQERLENFEGPEGIFWRYVKARSLLQEKEPAFDAARQLQQEIQQRAEDWDMGYLLKATIEERYLEGKPDDAEAKKAVIEAYQEAIRCGNVRPEFWNRLLALYEEANRSEDAQKLRREALIRNIRLETSPGQFPQPYQRMYIQANEAIHNESPQDADVVARQCIALAEGRRESEELIFSLNLAFGKLFMDENLLDSAKRHLEAVARRGGTFVYPLAVCMAKDDHIDAGFALLLDEIDRMPSSMGTLIPSLLVLLSQVQPSEEIFQRIDKLMTRIENGERLVLRGTVEEAGDDNFVPLGNRRIRTLLLRFPENTRTPDPASIVVFPPEEGEE